MTPQITPDDRIIMELNVKQDTVGAIFNGVPVYRYQSDRGPRCSSTTARLMVLGGIFTTDKNISTTKTPFIGDLPYVGRLFRQARRRRDDKTELLIFITPRIIQESLTSL